METKLKINNYGVALVRRALEREVQFWKEKKQFANSEGIWKKSCL